jgi:hypothetical protein
MGDPHFCEKPLLLTPCCSERYPTGGPVFHVFGKAMGIKQHELSKQTSQNTKRNVKMGPPQGTTLILLIHHEPVSLWQILVPLVQSSAISL